MEFCCKIGEKDYQWNTDVYHDIAIPLNFNKSQPLNYGVTLASSEPIGDIRNGDACNFDQLTMVPHCNGTHTECVGHITKDRIAIHDELKDVITPATLISLTPKVIKVDRIITKTIIVDALKGIDVSFLKALVVRTIPNLNDKQTKDYNKEIPPYFSLEAIAFFNELNINHLLVDIPSVDRIYDEGKLTNHHKFWQVKQGSYEINTNTQKHKTITEMIFVPNEVDDGCYLLNLQIAPFISDAAPSRPILFPVKEKV